MDAVKVIQVNSCRSCPFAHTDDMTGLLYCKESEEVENSLKRGESLPESTRHKLCPLDKRDIIIKGEKS